VLLALIIAVCMAAVELLGGNANSAFNSVQFASAYTNGEQLSGGTSASSGYWTNTGDGRIYNASDGSLYQGSIEGPASSAGSMTDQLSSGKLPTQQQMFARGYTAATNSWKYSSTGP
jgi:hypothetical protein